MITGKQRSYLKGLANQLDPLVFIGKADLTDTVIKEIDNVLNARERVKVKIQESSLLDPKETANRLADMLGAEFVQAIGRKFVLYRESKDNKKIYLPK